jgi:glycosyltransferase involved in cell wall biosynthesis
LDRHALSECEAVITSGKYHHPAIRKLTKKPIEVLYPACKPLFVPPPFDVRSRSIVTWDRWDIGNDPVVFLDLLEDIQAKDVKLTIGGFWHPRSLRREFEQEVKRLGLSERVELLGPLNDLDIWEICSRAMVHVHPCHEAFGMQVLEAAGCGCPSIIPSGSGVCELFEDGVSGWHPSDYWGIVNRLDLLFANPQGACQMGRAAHAVAKNRTWENYALDLADIVERYV